MALFDGHFGIFAGSGQEPAPKQHATYEKNDTFESNYRAKAVILTGEYVTRTPRYAWTPRMMTREQLAPLKASLFGAAT